MPKNPHFVGILDAKIRTLFSAKKSFAHDFPLPRKCESSGICKHNDTNDTINLTMNCNALNM